MEAATKFIWKLQKKKLGLFIIDFEFGQVNY